MLFGPVLISIAAIGIYILLIPILRFALLESGAELPEKVTLYKRVTMTTEPAVLFEQLPNIGPFYGLLYDGQNEFEQGEIYTEILTFLKGCGYIKGFSIEDNIIHNVML